MKIAERYLLKESIKTFLFGIALFSTILIVSKIEELLEFIVNKGISPVVIIKLLFFLMPALLSIAVPMAYILGVVLSIGRLSEAKEIIAMKTLGIGKADIVKPFVSFAVLLCIAMTLFNLFVMPESNKMYIKTLFNAITQKVQLVINEKEFSEVSDKIIIYTEEFDRKKNILNNINLRMKEQDGTMIIFAGTGEFFKDPDRFLYQFIMKDGSFSKLLENGDLINGIYDRMIVNIDLSTGFQHSDITDFGPRSMTLRELRAALKEELPPDVRNKNLTELYKRFSIPLAALSLLGFALFLALKLKVGSRALGIAVSIAFIFVYYIFMLIGFDLSEKGVLHPVLATNLPNILFLVPSIIGHIKL